MAGTTWPSLTAGKKAKASEVESKFDWIEGSIAPMNGGSMTNSAYDLGTSTAHWANIYVDKIANTCTFIELNFDTAKTEYFTVNGIAFQGNEGSQNGQGDDGWYREYNGGSLRNAGATVTTREYVHAVDIPDGASVTSLRLYYWQNNTNAAVRLELWRTDMQGSSLEMAQCDDQNISGWGTDDENSIASSTIDTSQYAYYLVAYLTDHTDTGVVALGGARITYEIKKV